MAHKWHGTNQIGRKSYVCGHCGSKVGPDMGYFTESTGTFVPGQILICPSCTKPTYFDERNRQLPSIRMGNDVKGISDAGVEMLYKESRDCTSIGAHTAAILILRKILMNIAVQHGATEGGTFISYINHLEANGFVPPNGKLWVDEIRKKGNEATHEIKMMTESESKQLMTFVEMLLRFVYEFPSMIVSPTP